MNITDRELLELAAKAAGYSHIKYCDVHMAMIPADDTYESVITWSMWNPLTNDGDAFKLMVMLGIQIDPRDPETRAFAPVGNRIDEYHKPNAYAATRRAIVRAAAEIGRRMA